MAYRLADILDIPVLQTMLDSLRQASGIPLGIIDAEGDVLISTGWQKICTEYHRKQPQVGERCLLNRLVGWVKQLDETQDNKPFEFNCVSGLTDIGLPIFFEGSYLGVLFLGQFFYEPPDPEYFRDQAVRFGFDPDDYMVMVEEVPVIPREKVSNFLDFHASLVRMLSDTGMQKLREEKARRSLEASDCALRESEERFRGLVNATPLGIVMYSLEDDGRLVFKGYNPAADEILGIDNSQFLGREILEAFPGLAETEIPERYRQVCLTGEPWRNEHFVYADEQVRGVFEFHAFRTAENQMASVFMDITERSLNLATVKKSEGTLGSILAAAPMSIGMVKERTFSWVNRWMTDELGYSEQELIGQKARMLYDSDEEFERVGVVKYANVSQGHMGEAQTYWVCKNGERIDVLLRSMPIDPENLAAGVIFTALNITEQNRYEVALQTNQALLKSVLNATDNAMLALDAERRVIYYNDRYLEFYPFDRNWLEQQPLLDDLIRKACEMGLYPSEQADELVARRLAHLDSVEKDRLIDTPRLDGMLLEAYVSQLAGGGHLISFRDITEKRKAEQDLRQSEEQVRLLLESSGEAIYGLDLKGLCTFANPMCLELLGYTDSQEILGKNTHKLFHHSYENGAPYPDKNCEIYKAVRYGQSVHVVDEVFWRRDGNAFPVEYWSYPVFKEGELVGSVVNFVDISERKRAEEKLKNALVAMEQAHEQINTIVRSVADGLMVIAPNGQIVLANPATEELLGQDLPALIGEDVRTILPDPGFLDRVSLALVGEEHLLPVDLAPWCQEDGRMRMLQARVAPVKDISEGLSGAVAILRDVTREYELNQIKDDFISTAAHELRTPMTAIIGYTEMMQDQLERLTHEQLQEFLDVVLKRSEALAHIISDMLDLSRVQSGRLIQLDKSPARIQDLVSRLVDTYRLKNQKFVFRTNDIDDLPFFCFDFDKMRQVFDNLLSNAIKFSPEGGDIDVQVNAEEEQMLIMVSDQGIGMTPEQVERVFDKFYRADASNTAVSGLGLGMSLVKSIVEGHGGRIWVESHPGAGTRVFLTLSRVDNDVE
jgi:PAS domain S-box-containing protein